ncbi:MAG: TIGR00725 family protein [Pseudomonadota bacterium]
MSKLIIAVIGDSEASENKKGIAREVGRLVAEKGWILVTGGLSGVMEAASQGASEAGGTVVGILPQGSKESANRYVAIPIATNMGHARNVIIAHTADALIAVGGGSGTLSEIAMAGKLGKPVFAINSWDVAPAVAVNGPQAAIEACERYLGGS